MIKRLALLLLVCSSVFAAECRGRVIDGATGSPLLKASLEINGVPGEISAEGVYAIQLPGDSQEYSYKIKLPDGRTLIYNTLEHNVNFQLGGKSSQAPKGTYKDARLRVFLKNDGKPLENADVSLWTIDAQGASALSRELRDDTNGQVDYENIDPTALAVLAVSANGNQYFAPVTGLIPDVLKETALDLEQFVPAGLADSAVVFAQEQWNYIPVSGNMFVTGNILPVYARTTQGTTQYSLGDPLGFPVAEETYYNLRQTVYSEGQGLTVVYAATGTKAYDSPRPGNIVFDTKLKVAVEPGNFTDKQLAQCRNYEVLKVYQENTEKKEEPKPND